MNKHRNKPQRVGPDGSDVWAELARTDNRAARQKQDRSAIPAAWYCLLYMSCCCPLSIDPTKNRKQKREQKRDRQDRSANKSETDKTEARQTRQKRDRQDRRTKNRSKTDPRDDLPYPVIITETENGIRIGFNADYVKDALHVLGVSEFDFDCTGPLSPAQGETDQGFALLLPVRLPKD